MFVASMPIGQNSWEDFLTTISILASNLKEIYLAWCHQQNRICHGREYNGLKILFYIIIIKSFFLF